MLPLMSSSFPSKNQLSGLVTLFIIFRMLKLKDLNKILILCKIKRIHLLDKIRFLAKLINFKTLFCNSKFQFYLAFLFAIIGSWGIAGGAHRLFAHRSYKANRKLQLLLIFFQTIALQNSCIEWVTHEFTIFDVLLSNFYLLALRYAIIVVIISFQVRF